MRQPQVVPCWSWALSHDVVHVTVTGLATIPEPALRYRAPHVSAAMLLDVSFSPRSGVMPQARQYRQLSNPRCRTNSPYWPVTKLLRGKTGFDALAHMKSKSDVLVRVKLDRRTPGATKHSAFDLAGIFIEKRSVDPTRLISEGVPDQGHHAADYPTVEMQTPMKAKRVRKIAMDFKSTWIWR